MSDPAIILTMIVRDVDQIILECLKSVIPHVNGAVILDTGSLDRTTLTCRDFFQQEWHCRFFHSDIVEAPAKKFADGDPLGRIGSFSLARNESLSIAKKLAFDCLSKGWRPFFLTLDADDVLVNGDRLRQDLKWALSHSNEDDGGPILLRMPYRYPGGAMDEPRNRLWRDGHCSEYVWKGKVHETLELQPVTGAELQKIYYLPNVYVEHRNMEKVSTSRNVESIENRLERNLRILKAANIPREMFYLARTLYDMNRKEEAKPWLEAYLKISCSPEEKCVAFLLLSYCQMEMGLAEAAKESAFRAHFARPLWGEPYFQLSRLSYFEKDWEMTVRYARTGLSLPRTRSGVGVSKRERDVEIFRYLAPALFHSGSVGEALEAVEEGLLGDPNHPEFLQNRGHFRSVLTSTTDEPSGTDSSSIISETK
jgi:tetratricopeptide (TPR) repeat protein